MTTLGMIWGFWLILGLVIVEAVAARVTENWHCDEEEPAARPAASSIRGQHRRPRRPRELA